jgi:hypothetical protein
MAFLLDIRRLCHPRFSIKEPKRNKASSLLNPLNEIGVLNVGTMLFVPHATQAKEIEK